MLPEYRNSGAFLRLIILALLPAAVGARADEVIPPVPAAYFNDYANAMRPDTALALNAELGQFERDTSNQIVVAIYPHRLSDAPVEDYTMRVAQAWGVGQRVRNNGVVLFMFVQEHQLYIQTGYGLQSALPDALCKRIIDEEIVPHLRQGDFDGGLTAGVHAILSAARGESQSADTTAANTAAEQAKPRAGIHITLGGFLIIGLWMGVIVGVIVLGLFLKKTAPSMPLAFLERYVIGACCALALLLFFFPLLAVHVPIAGDQQFSGYEVVSKLDAMRDNITAAGNPTTAESPANAVGQNAAAEPDIPLSLTVAWLIPVAIAGAFLCAGAALIGAFTSIKLVRAASGVGVLLAAVAILHVTIINSDVRQFLSNSMQTSSAALKDNPFAGFVQGLGELVANAIQVKPGWALCTLALLLAVVAICGYSRVLSRLRLAPAVASQ